jgi:hypothetical protein
MLKNYALLIHFFTLFSSISTAQNNISISKIEGSLCAGTDISVSYATQGTFNAGNKFKVQYRNLQNNLWIDLQTEGTSSPLKVILPKELDQPTNFSYYYFYFRIVGSSPISEGSSFGSISLKGLPSVTITTKENILINLDEPAIVNAQINGFFPMEATLSDSSKITILSSDLFRFYPEKSGDYIISKISNTCGVGTSSGKAKILLNQIGFKLSSVFPAYVCPKNKVNIIYSTQGTFNKDNVFTVSLLNSYTNSKYNVLATEKDGVITFTTPSNIQVGNYLVSVLTSSPETISTNPTTSGLVLNVSPDPSAEVITPNSTIFYGEQISISTLVRGSAPYLIKLSDGTVINYPVNSFINSGNPINTFVRPEKTTEYSVESYSTGCGSGIGTKKTIITVTDAILIDSLPTTKRYCAGETIKITFRTKAVINSNDKITVRLSREQGDYGSMVDIDGKLISSNSVEFILPTGVLQKIQSAEPFVKVFTSTLKGSYSAERLTVNEKPTSDVTFSWLPIQTYDNPQDVNIGIMVAGAGISNVILNDSLSFNLPTYNALSNMISVPVRVNKTTTFKINSVTNICGTTKVSSNDKRVVIISNPVQQSILLQQPNQLNFCGGSKIKVELSYFGNFNKDNEFKVELLPDFADNITNLGTIKSNTGEFQLPSVNFAGRYRLRVSSTSPTVSSSYIYIYLQKIPSLSYYVQGNNGNNFLTLGDKYTENFILDGGGPIEVIKLNGKIIKTIFDYSNSNSFSQSGILKADDVFGVKSISNSCGIGKITTSSIAKIVPYSLQLWNNSNYNVNLCQGSPLSLAVVKIGEKPNTFNYSIQIAKQRDTSFTTIKTKVTSNIAEVIIPSNYKTGYYDLRVISEDGLNIKSEPMQIFVNRFLSGSITTEKGTNEVTILGGENGTNLQIKSSDIGFWTFVMSDDKNNKYPNLLGREENFSRNVNPTETTTYTLKSISNECGYGTTSGSVKVIVKPNIKATINNNNNSNTLCVGDEITLNLTRFGTFEKDNKFSIVIYDDSTKKKEILSTAEAGSFKVKLPSNLQIGTYQVELSSSNPISKKIVQSINITSPPEAVLSGGGATINAGERVILSCTINPSQKTYFYDNVQYQLSDTTSGTIYSQGKNIIQTKPLFSSKTFTLTSISNICGIGKVSGSAKITVNPISAKQINIDNYFTNYPYFCQGTEAYIYFTTKGNFTTTNKFTVQLSDAIGENFKDIKTEGNTNPLKAFIPADLPVGSNYRFRITSSDKDATSTTNFYPLEIRQGMTARFDTSVYYFEPNKPVTVKIIFTGTAPYGFTLGSDEINAKQFNANSSPYLLTVNPISLVSYKIFRVANSECGIGTILPQNTVTLQLITSIEELKEMGINIFPNPTKDVLKIESDDKNIDITLFDMMGKKVLEKIINLRTDEISLHNLPSGTYLLRAQRGDKIACFKVMKY